MKKANKQTKALKYVTIDGQQVLVKNDQLINPLFVGSMGSAVNLMDPQTMYQTFDSVLVMCVKDNVQFDSDLLLAIYDYVVDNEKMNDVFKYFTVFRADMSMIKNKKHKNFSNVLNGSFLKTHFPEMDFEVTEIVIPLFEMTKTNATMYASLYSEHKEINGIKKMLNLTNHYNAGYKKPVEDQLIGYLKDMEKSFWSYSENCQINMTDMFGTRGFDYKDVRDDGIREALVANVTDRKESPDEIKKRVINVMATEGKEIDYISAAMSTKKTFVDIYDALGTSGKRTYYAKIDNQKLVLNETTIIDLYNSTSEDFEKYYLLNNLLTSKDYCHLILNNSKMLDITTPFINKHKTLFKYTMAYSWFCMYIEECIFKTKSTSKSRFVFDIETAHKLPVFYTCMDDIWQNPYVSLLVNKAIADVTNNCMSLHGIADTKYYGTCNLVEFKKRFNLFTTGDPDRNVLNGLEWNKFAVSGSIMSACLQKESPLISNVASNDISDSNRLLMFFQHYYGTSDIDLMCSTMSVYEFISCAGQVFNVIKNNLPDYKEGDIEIEPIKSTAVVVTQHFFKERLSDLNDEVTTDYTAEEVINLIDTRDDDVVEYFYDLYQTVKKKNNRDIRKNSKELSEKYKFDKTILKLYTRKTMQGDINIKFRDNDVLLKDYNQSDGETCFYINDFRDDDNKVSADENFMVYKVCEGIRYKFTFKKLMRCIELFQVRGNDFFSVVGRFHFPCVRSYYQGDNVYMLPSCITAMMTGINIEYKYFAGTNDPVKIGNKYITRGYGAIFNKKELKHMAYYNSEVDEDNGMYHIPDKNKDSIKHLFSPKEISDKIFKPLVFKKGIAENTYLNPDLKYIKTESDLRDAYKSELGYDATECVVDMFKFKAVTDKGNVQPLQKWIIDAYWKSHGENVK